MRRRERRRIGDQLGIDRRADQLGQLDQLGERAALRDRVARHDHRAFRRGEKLRGGLDRGAVAARARRDARRRHQVEIGLVLQDVAGQRQEHRPGRRRERGLGGAMHQQRQVLQPMHLARPFHQRARDRRQLGIEDRLGPVEVLVVLAGGDEDRRAGLLRVVQHAHRVAEAGRDVQVHDRELAGGLRVAVRHRHHGGFLQAEHVAHLVVDRERVHQRQLGGAGIAEQHIDTFLLQQFQERALSGNDGQGILHVVLRERATGGRAYLRSRYLCSPVRTSSPF